jgi:integrase
MGSTRSTGRTRANGEGSYRVRGKSVEFRWDGKSISEKVNGRTLPELRKRLDELCSMPSSYNAKETIPMVGQEWLNSLDEQVDLKKMERSTVEGYKYTFAIIQRMYKDIEFVKATPKELYNGIVGARKVRKEKDGVTEEVAVIETDEPYDIGTLRKMRAMLGQIYAYGVFTDRINATDDPTRYIPEIKTTERKQSKKEAYTEDQVVFLLNNLEETATGYAARLCLARGYRGQEVVVLTADDIAEDGSTIRICKALKRGEKGHYYTGNTKSAASDRLDYIPEFARPWAMWLREHAVNGYILPNDRRGHVTTEVWRQHYYAAVTKTGIKPLAPHQMRHTFITTLRTRMGTEGKIVMSITGQSDPRAMEGYNHVDMEAKRKVAQKQDRYIRNLLAGKKESRKTTSYKIVPIGDRLGKNPDLSSKQAN